MDNTAEKRSRTVVDILLIGLKLLAVCAVVAALISGVNALTDAKYQSNLKEEKRKAIIQIFNSETLTYTERTVGSLPETVYEVKEGDRIIGYCVEVAGTGGFGGDINMMVGFAAEDGSVKGVSIVSLNETPGLGARVKEPSYLAQYIGKSGTLALGTDVDAITGATYSSTAVLNGVNRATFVLNQMYAGEDAQ